MVDLARYAGRWGVRTNEELGVLQVVSNTFKEFNFAIVANYEKARAVRALAQIPIWFEDDGNCVGQHQEYGRLLRFVGMTSSGLKRTYAFQKHVEWMPCESCDPAIKQHLLIRDKRYTPSEMAAREKFGFPGVFQSWIIATANEPIATISAFVNGEGIAGLFDLWVTPEERGSETAKAVLSEVVSRAGAMGARTFVVQALPKVALLLERIGFRRTSELLMWLPVTESPFLG